MLLVLGIGIILVMLLYAKIGSSITDAITNIFTLKQIGFREIIPLGISYYTFSIIGYMLDVYWKKEKAEHNFFKFLLYMIYFPHIIQGPIPRYKRLAPQLIEGHKFSYKNLCYGLQRIIWGYFKKMVIADRFALLTHEVFNNYSQYEGFIFIVAAVCSSIELYCDFSGCMDIVLGASRLFGIRLPENFDAPFFSRTVQEFWQRWHITLGVWFKDYVMYPIQKSKPMVRLGKKAKKRLGKKVGKKVPFYLSMVVLWFLIGIWHGGTGYYFMASAAIPFLWLMGGDFAQPFFAKLRERCGVRDGAVFRLLQRARTLLLICVCWVFVCAAGTGEGFQVLKQILTQPFVCRIGEVAGVGSLGKKTLLIFLLTLLLAAAEYILRERDSSLRQFLENRKLPARVAFVYAELLMILFLGMVGSSAFIYFQF